MAHQLKQGTLKNGNIITNDFNEKEFKKTCDGVLLEVNETWGGVTYELCAQKFSMYIEKEMQNLNQSHHAKAIFTEA